MVNPPSLLTLSPQLDGTNEDAIATAHGRPTGATSLLATTVLDRISYLDPSSTSKRNAADHGTAGDGCGYEQLYGHGCGRYGRPMRTVDATAADAATHGQCGCGCVINSKRDAVYHATVGEEREYEQLYGHGCGRYSHGRCS